jgi:hypothetical protein
LSNITGRDERLLYAIAVIEARARPKTKRPRKGRGKRLLRDRIVRELPQIYESTTNRKAAYNWNEADAEMPFIEFVNIVLRDTGFEDDGPLDVRSIRRILSGHESTGI